MTILIVLTLITFSLIIYYAKASTNKKNSSSSEDKSIEKIMTDIIEENKLKLMRKHDISIHDAEYHAICYLLEDFKEDSPSPLNSHEKLTIFLLENYQTHMSALFDTEFYKNHSFKESFTPEQISAINQIDSIKLRIMESTSLIRSEAEYQALCSIIDNRKQKPAYYKEIGGLLLGRYPHQVSDVLLYRGYKSGELKLTLSAEKKLLNRHSYSA